MKVQTEEDIKTQKNYSNRITGWRIAQKSDIQTALQKLVGKASSLSKH